MRLQIKAKIYLILGVIALLAGCGFHLRGAVTFPEEYKTVYISSNEPAYSRDGVGFYLQRQLRSQLDFVTDEASADLIIKIDESYDTRVIASSQGGALREYTSNLQARIVVVDANGRVLFPAETFTRSQDYSLNEQAPLAKATAEYEIKGESAEELSRAFIRRLTTVIRAGK